MLSEPPGTAPSLSTFLASLRNHNAEDSVAHLIALLKRRQIWGARRCAIATAHLLIVVVAESKPKSSNQLLGRVRSVGKQLIAAQPREITIGNVSRRVLGLVREASDPQANGDLQDGQTDRAQAAITAASATSSSPEKVISIKEDVLDGMRELLDELDQADKQIAEYAPSYIYPEETILTYGASIVVQKFLLDAAKRRKFTVIQVEGFPNQHTSIHEMALRGAMKGVEANDIRLKTLAATGINVICVPDSATFAIMTRVNKVIFSAQAILSNGAFVGPAGSKLVAKAAKFHQVPVLVLGAVYRMSPAFPSDPSRMVDVGDPGKVTPYSDGAFLENVGTSNWTRDYISQDQVDLIISNVGGHAPGSMNRVTAEPYRTEDIDPLDFTSLSRDHAETSRRSD